MFNLFRKNRYFTGLCRDLSQIYDRESFNCVPITLAYIKMLESVGIQAVGVIIKVKGKQAGHVVAYLPDHGVYVDVTNNRSIKDVTKWGEVIDSNSHNLGNEVDLNWMVEQ